MFRLFSATCLDRRASRTANPDRIALSAATTNPITIGSVSPPHPSTHLTSWTPNTAQSLPFLAGAVGQ
jgi:hypothetical protein